MTRVPARFPHNDILSLTAEAVRYDLAESVGPDIHVGELLALAPGETLDDLALSYGTAGGDAELRRLIAGRYDVGADDVVVTVGGMQTLFLLAFILCEPGDDVVAAKPLFPNARSVLESVGANVVDLPVLFDEGYRIDRNRLRACLTPGTKLVSLASPQNPSGVAFSEDDVTAVLALMDDICPGAFLLIDDTYREAVYGEDAVRPSLVHLDDRVVSCASLSKCHGAPGLRTGWAVTRHPALREQLVLGKFNTSISNSRIDDALSIRVLRNHDRIIGARRPHLLSGLERTAAFVQRNGNLVEWVRPDAGALCCIRLRPAAFDGAAVEAFYAGLKEKDVRVGRGSWFGEEDRVFRLGFGLLAMPDLDEGLARIASVLSATADTGASASGDLAGAPA